MKTTNTFLILVAVITVCKARMLLVETADKGTKDSSDGECRNDSDCSGRKVCIVNAFAGIGLRATCQHCQHDHDCPWGKICNRSECEMGTGEDYGNVRCSGARSCHIDVIGKGSITHIGADYGNGNLDGVCPDELPDDCNKFGCDKGKVVWSTLMLCPQKFVGKPKKGADYGNGNFDGVCPAELPDDCNKFGCDKGKVVWSTLMLCPQKFVGKPKKGADYGNGNFDG